eukprot:Hpha_TRINITY_DN8386_c0_g1::TRINITY_DN8386_c0_g1_i2::g.154441::m.154441
MEGVITAMTANWVDSVCTFHSALTPQHLGGCKREETHTDPKHRRSRPPGRIAGRPRFEPRTRTLELFDNTPPNQWPVGDEAEQVVVRLHRILKILLLYAEVLEARTEHFTQVAGVRSVQDVRGHGGQDPASEPLCFVALQVSPHFEQQDDVRNARVTLPLAAEPQVPLLCVFDRNRALGVARNDNVEGTSAVGHHYQHRRSAPQSMTFQHVQLRIPQIPNKLVTLSVTPNRDDEVTVAADQGGTHLAGAFLKDPRPWAQSLDSLLDLLHCGSHTVILTGAVHTDLVFELIESKPVASAQPFNAIPPPQCHIDPSGGFRQTSSLQQITAHLKLFPFRLHFLL